jgi:hypothetical protein
VIKLGARRPETRFDIAQAFSVGQLRERHAQELIPARETLDFVIALVTFHTQTKILSGKKIDQLGEDRLAGIHSPPPAAKFRQNGVGLNRNSNRFYSLHSQQALFQQLGMADSKTLGQQWSMFNCYLSSVVALRAVFS